MRPHRLLLVASLAAVTGCSFKQPSLTQHIPRTEYAPCRSAAHTPRKLAVFFDGTANDEGSHTNISKLYNLTTLQPRCDINALYVEGVGIDGPLGGATGLGIGVRVMSAYQWLAMNFDATRNDSLFIFGFSRGAYSARILAALVYAAGLPDFAGASYQETAPGIRYIYDRYKGEFDSLYTRKRIATAAVRSQGWESRPASIAFLGLFDSVEALGVSTPFWGRVWPTGEHVEDTNERYGDQLCNVGRAAQALSLDDPRAFIFTPKLLTRQFLVEQCPNHAAIELDAVVNEVWFAGAHSDVGGQKGTDLDDVPLNWMIRQLAPYGLLSRDSVYADPLGPANHPRERLWTRAAYGYRKRDIGAMLDSTRYNVDPATGLPRLKVHASVLRRLETFPILWWQNEWHVEEPFTHCFRPRLPNGNLWTTTYVFTPSAQCPIEIVH